MKVLVLNSIKRLFLGISILVAWVESGLTQVTPVAPVASSEASPSAAPPTSTNTRKSAVLLGNDALKSNKPQEAIQHFQNGLVPYADWTNSADSDAYLGMANAYQAVRDHDSAIHFAQCVSRLRFAGYEPNSPLAKTLDSDPMRIWNSEMLTGFQYLELDQFSTGMDFIRRTASDFEDPIALKMAAAVIMLRAPTAELRDAKEAMLYGREFIDDSDNPVLFEKAMAMAAAELGEFDLAIARQKILIERVPADARREEEKVLEDYKRKVSPPFSSTRSRIDNLRGKESIERDAIRTMAILEVSGKIAIKPTGDTTQANDEVRDVRFNVMGSFLNRFGEIITSSEVNDLPIIVNDKPNPVRAERWVEGPNINVYACLSADGIVATLGAAESVVADSETGVAVVKLKPPSPYAPIPFVRPIKFQPEFRQYDDTWNQAVKSYFEFKLVPRAGGETSNSSQAGLEGIDPSIVLQSSGKFVIQDRPGGQVERRVYQPRHHVSIVPYSVAKLIVCDNSEASVGSPLFNGLGECIGIFHPTWHNRKMSTAIPACICSRVSSKLLSQGELFRMHVPLIVGAVGQTQAEAGSNTPIHGMYVSKLESPYTKVFGKDIENYRPLLEKIIVSVDGYHVPTHTEWLAALERLRAMATNEQVEFEVVDEDFKNRKTIRVQLIPEDGAAASRSIR